MACVKQTAPESAWHGHRYVPRAITFRSLHQWARPKTTPASTPACSHHNTSLRIIQQFVHPSTEWGEKEWPFPRTRTNREEPHPISLPCPDPLRCRASRSHRNAKPIFISGSRTPGQRGNKTTPTMLSRNEEVRGRGFPSQLPFPSFSGAQRIANHGLPSEGKEGRRRRSALPSSTRTEGRGFPPARLRVVLLVFFFFFVSCARLDDAV